MEAELIQYQNANHSFESIVDNFIVRTNEFERVMDDIRNTDSASSFQHYVFVGRRGSGKSTLLRRIQAEINLDVALQSKYEVVNLGEEQSFIYRLYDLWDYVIRELNTMGYSIQEIDFRKYKDDMKAYTKELHAQIIKALRASNKRLVLLLDNIDRILDSRSGNMDAALFRELLINFHDIRIIGGSTVMSEHFWKYDKPFYQFFSIKKLVALTLKEVEQLLSHWSQVKGTPEIQNIIQRYPGKIQSIRMLTDGMPRTMLLFVDMMINRPAQHGYQYLQQIVDKATPIYQERLGILSDAQRKVLSELAFLWDAAYVEDLVPKCNMEGKVISALLKQLVDIKYVEKIKTKNKNHLYRVEERFFNLWFNMTQGGLNQRAKAKALTDFLEKWYEKPELNDLCKELSSMITKGEANRDYIESMSQALLGSEKIESEYKDTLKSHLINNGLLQDADFEFGNGTGKKSITEAFENGEYQKTIALLENSKIEEGVKFFGLGLAYEKLNDLIKAEKYYLLAAEKGNNKAFFNLATLLKNQGRNIDAEKYYLLAINKGDKSSLNDIGVLYIHQGRKSEAEKYFLIAIGYGVEEALFNLALFYHLNQMENEAEKYYLLSIKKGITKALYNLGFLYQNQGKEAEAGKFYKQAIEKGDVLSLYNLAMVYQRQGDDKEAEKYYLIAIEKGNVNALNNLAGLYEDQGKEAEAEKYYQLAIENGDVNALNNLANLYSNQGKEEEAKKYYLLALEKSSLLALYNLALFYYDRNRKSDVTLLINALTQDKLNEFIEIYFDFALIIFLYIGDISKYNSLVEKYITEEKPISSFVIRSLLIHKQYNWVYKFFISNQQMIEKFNPLYFATLHLLGDKDQEILKMAPEIQENVEDILKEIKQKQEFYSM